VAARHTIAAGVSNRAWPVRAGRGRSGCSRSKGRVADFRGVTSTGRPASVEQPVEGDGTSTLAEGPRLGYEVGNASDSLVGGDLARGSPPLSLHGDLPARTASAARHDALQLGKLVVVRRGWRERRCGGGRAPALHQQAERVCGGDAKQGMPKASTAAAAISMAGGMPPAGEQISDDSGASARELEGAEIAVARFENRGWRET